jgi:uncharacterized protein (DUF58 family)
VIKKFLHRLQQPWIFLRRCSPEREVWIELRQPLILFVLLVLFVWYLAAPARVIAIALSGCAGLSGLALLWAWRMALRVEARRRLTYAAMQVGDELEERITLWNHGFFPAVWAEFVDRSNLPGYTVSGVRAVGGWGEMAWRVHTICKLRGVYSLGPWILRLGEPFGLFEVGQRYQDKQQILVYPPLAALPGELLPHRGAQGDHRPLNQPIAAETADGMTVRAYTPGDPLHKIHWPTTARSFTPYVKVFEPEAASRIWLVPDFDAGVQIGQGVDSTEETMVLLAASLAARLLQERLAVGLFAGLEAPVLVLPQRGQPHLWTLLERLAPLHCQTGRPLSEALERLHPMLAPRDMLVVITPSSEPAWPAALNRVVRSRGMGSAEAILLDPLSFGGLAAVDGLMEQLAANGFQTRLVKKGQIEATKGAYGALNRWEFMVSATGRAIARRAPRRAAALIYARQGEENKV